jgi:PAS domain S-box-containing protein
MFLGIGYFFIGILDTLHIFTYSGVSVIFKNGSQSIAVQFWISASYLMAFTLLGSILLLNKNIEMYRAHLLFFIYLLVAVLVIVSILYFKNYPKCYVSGKGPTKFKITSEYIISSVFLLAAILYFMSRKIMDFNLFFYMECHLLSMAVSEIMFIDLLSPFHWTIVWSHVIRVTSYFFLCKVVFEIGLNRPYTILHSKIDEIDNELHMTGSKLKQEQNQRRMMEEMLVRNDHCYELIIDNSSDAITVSSEGRFIFANDKASVIFGVDKPGDLIGMEVKKFIHFDETDSVKYVRTLRSKPATHSKSEYKLVSLNGEEIDVEVLSDYLLYKGQLSKINIFKDESARKQISKLKDDIRDNEKVLNETKEYSRLLTEFFSNISHELKTPLNVILGAIQILAQRHEADFPHNFEASLNKYLKI